MMESSSSCENNKKCALEELPKEELIKKYKSLLIIAQKAKQAKDILQEENNALTNQVRMQKISNDDASNVLVENLTQQKLLHVTTIEDLKAQVKDLNNKYKLCSEELSICQSKNNELDNENLSYKRQVHRLTEENEQLLTHLDNLEGQIEEFKRIGIQQQEQLLAFESRNELLAKNCEKTQNETENKIAELQSMLSVSLEELQKVKSENSVLLEKVDNLKINLVEKDKNILLVSEELNSKSKEVESLNVQLNNLDVKKCDHLTEQNEELHREISDYQKSCAEKDAEIVTLQESLNGVKDLEETINRLKERVKLYHSKIIKFASSIKVLKESKNEMLTLFKTYTEQVEDWKTKLTTTSETLINLINGFELRNNELLKENQNLKENNQKLVEQLEAHKTDDEKSKELIEIENVRSENRRLTENINALLTLQEQYKEQISMLTCEKETINDQLLNALEKHQEEIKIYDDQNKKDSLEIQFRKDENEKVCIEYRKIISKLEADIEVNLRELGELKLNNSVLQEELEHLKENERQFAEKTSEEILKLVKENAELTETNKKLMQAHITVHESESQTDNTNFSDCNLEEVVANLRRENSEVLTEMNEMNQALKERGETISKLQAHCEEVMKKMQIYEAQANKNVDSISQKEELIKNLQQELENHKAKTHGHDLDQSNLTAQRDAEIAMLKSEIESLKEKCHSHLDSNYAESENMSTSTISRAEEASRLKDLEGSWEERYGKLRNLALKLKGKIRELTGELSREQNEKADLQQKYTNSIKTVTTLQTQCDKLEDDLEVSKRETKDVLEKLDLAAAEISADKQKLAENDEIVGNLKKQIDELNKEKSNTETWKKQIGAKIQALRKELEAKDVMIKDYKSQISKLSGDLEAKEQALKAESDFHKQTKTSLEQSNYERKKNSVLSLEMQDYERSVKELSQKLDKKQEEIDRLKTQTESQKSTVNALREQNKLLEERVQEAKNDLDASKAEVFSCKKKIADLESLVQQKDEKVQNVTKLLETVRSENEELSTELSKVIAEHQKLNASLKSEKEHLRNQSFGLQQALRETQDTLKLTQEELKAVQDEYNHYKVRAQSVLRQNQNRDVGMEEKLAEEIGSLRAKCEGLDNELRECRTTIESLKKEHENCPKEKEDAVLKIQELTSEIEDTKKVYDQLSSKHQQTISEHADSVRNLKIHAETLAQCYRQQISELEVRHNREIVELQSKIENLTAAAPSLSANTAPNEATSIMPSLLSSMMPREEGEGSENVENNNKTNVLSYPVPLERLLNSSSNEDQESVFLRKQLQEEESKVMHLTALLADTEQDLAKHAQMNKLLKEEIRRQQRSVEREKHAENLEYLKNVVFKFVTLHSGDERSRLVPVLNTILKLSPEETEKLNRVAKGDPGLRGWSNYLPTWSSPSSSKS